MKKVLVPAAALLALTAGLVPSTAASAAPPTHPTHAQISAAGQRVIDGKSTQADIATIKAGDPDLLKHLPASGKAGSASGTSAPTAADKAALVKAGATPAQAAAYSYCNWHEGYWTTYDVTGLSIIYRWHHRITVCGVYNSYIGQITSNYYYVDHRDWTWVDNGISQRDDGATGYWNLLSTWAGHMSQFKYGFSHYPLVQIDSYANGNAWFYSNGG